jgi:hypothetical protein
MKRLGYQARKEAEGLEAMIRTEPDSYFVESWRESARVLRQEAEMLYAEERAYLEGKTYNTFTDTWE